MIDTSWPEDRSCTYSLIWFCLKYCMPRCEQMLKLSSLSSKVAVVKHQMENQSRLNDSLVLAVGL
jgi:hypothetical protein